MYAGWHVYQYGLYEVSMQCNSDLVCMEAQALRLGGWMGADLMVKLCTRGARAHQQALAVVGTQIPQPHLIVLLHATPTLSAASSLLMLLTWPPAEHQILRLISKSAAQMKYGILYAEPGGLFEQQLTGIIAETCTVVCTTACWDAPWQQIGRDRI